MQFVTYITFYGGDKMPPFYIGSSSKLKIAKGYHGTVTSKMFKTVWNQEIKDNPELFSTFVLTEHHTSKEAKKQENNIQHLLDVVKCPLFINRGYATQGFFGPCRQGIKSSAAHCAKISASLKGKSKSPKHCENLKKALTGRKLSATHAQKSRDNFNKGRPIRTYVLFSPSGEKFIVTGGLRKFCISQGISFSKIYRHINKGIIKQSSYPRDKAKECAGWSCSS